MLPIGYGKPLGLTTRPAPPIVRELPPSPKTYGVQVFSQAAPAAAPAIAWSAGARRATKKPLAAAPSESLFTEVGA